MKQQRQNISELNIGVAYILWALACVGFCGIHRFYVGKFISGLIYFFTFGLFGLGQFIDLFFIPSMVQERNYYIQAKLRAKDMRDFAHIGEEILRNQTESSFRQKEKNYNFSEIADRKTDPLIKLLKAAAANNNILSVGQAIIVMELPVEQVKELLNKAVKEDLAHIGNEPETGAVRYYFDI